MLTKYTPFEDAVKLLQKENRLRTLKPMIPINGAFIFFQDLKMLSFCSHDYLGISENQEVKKNAIKYLLEHGLTATTKPQNLYLNCQKNLEELVSRILAQETTLFFPSRFQANVTTLSTLTQRAPHVFIDEASHPSLFEGAKKGNASIHVYPHERIDLLESLVKKHQKEQGIIVAESIFSLTGSITDILKLSDLATRTNHLLLVDDSHALGTCGIEGMGLASNIQKVDIITGSFNKAFGVQGGFVSCSKVLRDYLTSHTSMRTDFLLPPPFIGAIESALNLIPQMEGERKQLEQRSHWLRSSLRQIGFDLLKTNTPIISLVYNNVKEIEEVRSRLQKKGILVGPTQYFQESQSKPRLNFFLNVCHMPDHLAKLVDALNTS